MNILSIYVTSNHHLDHLFCHGGLISLLRFILREQPAGFTVSLTQPQYDD